MEAVDCDDTMKPPVVFNNSPKVKKEEETDMTQSLAASVDGDDTTKPPLIFNNSPKVKKEEETDMTQSLVAGVAIKQEQEDIHCKCPSISCWAPH